MEKFRTQLYEESQAMQFALDSRGGREFSLKKKSGVLARSFDGTWKSRALETSSKEEAATALGWKNSGRQPLDPPRLPVDAGEILGANRFLTDCLQRPRPAGMAAAFPGPALPPPDPQHAPPGSAERLQPASASPPGSRLRGETHELEVSEGSSEELKFNLNGLAGRIGETVENQKNRRRVALDRQVPVVLQAGEGAILFHEILGHSLEADYVHQGISPFSPSGPGPADRPRSDHHPLPRPARSVFQGCRTDDEGETCPSPLLVEKGVLRRFISDYAHQKLLRLNDRGHARLEDFSRIPQPRMFATYVQPGSVPAAEIVASTPYGIYAREFGDGGLDFRSGRFYFNIRQSYLIEKGRLTAAFGNLTVSGSDPGDPAATSAWSATISSTTAASATARRTGRSCRCGWGSRPSRSTSCGSMEARVLETVMKTGREAGFSTVEAFAEKVLRQESDGVDQSLSLHEVQSDRVLVRAFRDSGDPLGIQPFRSRCPPGQALLRRRWLPAPRWTGKRISPSWLPKSVPKVKLDIYDPGIELWDEDAGRRPARKGPGMPGHLPGAETEKIPVFPGPEESLPGQHARVSSPSTKKRIFQVQVSFMLTDHVLELSETRTHFRNFDPQRLVARGANLLGALAAGEEDPAADGEALIMSPEASAQVLKEFSPGLKLDRAGGQGPRHRRFAAAQHPGQSRPGRAVRLGALRRRRHGGRGEVPGQQGGGRRSAADIRTAFDKGGSSTGNGFRDERGIFPRVQFSNLYIKPSNVSLAQLLRQARQGRAGLPGEAEGPRRPARRTPSSRPTAIFSPPGRSPGRSISISPPPCARTCCTSAKSRANCVFSTAGPTSARLICCSRGAATPKKKLSSET